MEKPQYCEACFEAKDNAALRAQVVELKKQLAEEREYNRDIPTIAYMSGAADWKEATKMREAERDEARAKCERLEWLAEVQAFKLYRPKIRPTRVRGIAKGTWKRWTRSNAELRETLRAALAECEEVDRG